jgi:hypothetical protein
VLNKAISITRVRIEVSENHLPVTGRIFYN